ncbi:hypothetical protein [Brasilonema sp. UFV-L1]|uniref:hypothetical protein n=1 Tax=Brasilonema sp. UFV-L1 TaxID=2234130 RepID=UPI002006E045|nr:hypothetical protein [Brasilonema sp. UFV-L1]
MPDPKPPRNELLKILPLKPKPAPKPESVPPQESKSAEPVPPAPKPEPVPPQESKSAELVELAPKPEPVPPQESKSAEPVEPATQEQTDQTVQAQQPETISNQEQVQVDAEKQAEEEPKSEQSTAIFQAVGVITGEVRFTDEGKSSVTIGRKEYPLFYAPRKQKAFEALKKEIEATSQSNQRLVVYPKFIHFPKREQPPQVSFQLVGFDKGRQEEVVSGELQDMEFKLCGLWQFIPVCQTPCISVFRNFNQQRLEYIKTTEVARKVKFMKASHIPLIWKDAPARPFRFNPKATKEEQGRPVFVQVKAKFLPGRDVFGFVEQLAEPVEKAPKFLKVSKEDKATAMAEKKAALRAAGKDTKAPRSKPYFNKDNSSNKDNTSFNKDKPKPKPKPKDEPKT